jgi:hypothetical protein
VAIIITGVGVAALIAAAVRLSGGVEALLSVIPFMIWGLAPFALALFGLRGRGGTTPRVLGIVAASGFGMAMYANLYLASRLSSTAGLAFLFIPLWQLLGCGAVLVLTRSRGKSDEAA